MLCFFYALCLAATFFLIDLFLGANLIAEEIRLEVVFLPLPFSLLIISSKGRRKVAPGVFAARLCGMSPMPFKSKVLPLRRSFNVSDSSSVIYLNVVFFNFLIALDLSETAGKTTVFLKGPVSISTSGLFLISSSNDSVV